MLTELEIHEIVDSLNNKQTDRLIRSGLGVETFLAQTEEMCVTFEMSCYDHLLRKMAQTSV